jgi:hypothetical protein
MSSNLDFFSEPAPWTAKYLAVCAPGGRACPFWLATSEMPLQQAREHVDAAGHACDLYKYEGADERHVARLVPCVSEAA